MNQPSFSNIKKHFPDRLSLESELQGLDFFAEYYPLTPKVISCSKQPGKFELELQNVSFATRLESKTVTDLLAIDIYPVGFMNILNTLAHVHKKHSKIMQAGGGTKKFYIDRCSRLKKLKFITDYQSYCDLHPYVFINGLMVEIDRELINKTLQTISKLNYGLCVPSQGDFHERNVFSNGYIVDFEAAGWNLLSTDAATFLWHSLLGGNYFGPKYANWSTKTDKELAAKHYSKLNLKSDNLTLALSLSRKQIILEYLREYLSPLRQKGWNDTEIGQAVAFRLLTMFETINMTKNDRYIIYAFANYFYPQNINYDLVEKVSALVNDNKTSDLALSTKSSDRSQIFE